MGPEVIKRLREIIGKYGVKKGTKVLDVACRTGILTPILFEAVGEDGEVTGIDFAPEMVEQARAKNFGPNALFRWSM